MSLYIPARHQSSKILSKILDTSGETGGRSMHSYGLGWGYRLITCRMPSSQKTPLPFGDVCMRILEGAGA